MFRFISVKVEKWKSRKKFSLNSFAKCVFSRLLQLSQHLHLAGYCTFFHHNFSWEIVSERRCIIFEQIFCDVCRFHYAIGIKNCIEDRKSAKYFQHHRYIWRFVSLHFYLSIYFIKCNVYFVTFARIECILIFVRVRILR